MLADDEIWTTVLSFANVDDSEECFTTILQGLLDALLLLHCIRIKQHVNLWAATSSIRTATHLRDELYCQALILELR